MYGIELVTIFYKYENKNHKINTSFVTPGLLSLRANITSFSYIILFKYLRKDVYNTMR